MWGMDVIIIGVGALAGAVTAGIGYLKSFNIDDNGIVWEHEDFKGWKFLKTTLLGGVVGGSVASTGWTTEAVHALLSGIGATLIVENTAKWIWREIDNRFL